MKAVWQTIIVASLREPNAKTPRSFLVELIRRACGVEATHSYETDATEIPRQERVSHGYVGTDAVGFRWAQLEPLVSSMFPVQVEYTTYGIPSCEVRWAFSLEQDGQAGRHLYRHRQLQVRVGSDGARAILEQAWLEMFGVPPTFEA